MELYANLKAWLFPKKILAAHPDTPLEYAPFTTAYDETVKAEALPRILGPLTPQGENSFKKACHSLHHDFTGERLAMAKAAAETIRALQPIISDWQRSRLVVSFLIDHSGSMKGLRMLSALLAVAGAVDMLSQMGIATEILGFTTVGWKGGQSRKDWIRAGSPANPGRLCDIRHIIYAPFDRSISVPRCLDFALRPDLLHENIDGEALQWAAGRLEPTRWDRRIICVLSDGAPVDDSTLLSNSNPQILLDHLQKVVSELSAQGFVIGMLSLVQENYCFAPLAEAGIEPEAAGVSLIRLVRRAIEQETGRRSESCSPAVI